MTKIQEHFEDSNLELDLSKNVDGHYLNEVTRYAWMNWMTAYSFGREHQANIANKAIETANAEPEPSFTCLKKVSTENLPPEFERILNENLFSLYESDEVIDIHAALRAEYAKQVKEGTTGFYLWEYRDKYQFDASWKMTIAPNFTSSEYRCTDFSCYVSKDGDPATRMLRTDAQALQRKLGDTVEWLTTPGGEVEDWYLYFEAKGIYTYRTKALKQVKWEDVPRRCDCTFERA